VFATTWTDAVILKASVTIAATHLLTATGRITFALINRLLAVLAKFLIFAFPDRGVWCVL
jgi:hypothetical protein